MGLLESQWEKLTLPERIHVCHRSAQEAEQLAHTAPPRMEAEYRRLAAEWRQLAAALEQFRAEASAVGTAITASPEYCPPERM